ncbi:MAG: hypothetical protein KGM49_06285 [Sphingomonadales bacterium]|nr:hypothetical protein [Sphingomonadales bacterium]
MTDMEAPSPMETSLERAVEKLGDIVPLVMARFFATHPEAKASFAHHQPDNPARLQAEMVDNALYILMTWHSRRTEIEITLGTSVPHHVETLKVPTAWYAGLIEATIDVIAEGASPRSFAEHEMWAATRHSLSEFVVIEAVR